LNWSCTSISASIGGAAIIAVSTSFSRPSRWTCVIVRACHAIHRWSAAWEQVFELGGVARFIGEVAAELDDDRAQFVDISF
jgi:hypothetical protein